VSERQRNVWVGAGLLVLGVVLGGAIYLAMSGDPAPARKAPKISLIPTTPPPPPPPPKEDKRPEPPKEIKDVKEVPQAPPKDAPPAPPSQDLKMDGPAGDGPSAFSSGAITNEDLSKIGKGEGGGAEEAKGLFNPHTNYATLLKGELQRHLARNKDLRPRAYRVQVHVWVNGAGQLTRHEIVGSTGDEALDAALGAALAGMGTFSDPPPASMPMPIRLRLQASGRG